MTQLTPREAQFVAHYIATRNARQSAIDAGWSDGSAGATGTKLLRKPDIVAALAEAGVAIAHGPHPATQIRKPRAPFVKQGLTLLQERFVSAYLVCANATEAARRAGLPGKKPEFSGAKMIHRPAVAAAIAAAREESARRTQITADRVLIEQARIAFADIGDLAAWDAEGLRLLPHDAVARDDRAAIAEIRSWTSPAGTQTIIRMHAKHLALAALAKHLGLDGRKPPGAAPPTQEQTSARRELRERLARMLEVEKAKLEKTGES